MSSIGLKFIAVYTRAIYFIATKTVFPYKQNSPLDPQSERKYDARKKGTGHRFLDNHNCLFFFNILHALSLASIIRGSGTGFMQGHYSLSKE